MALLKGNSLVVVLLESHLTVVDTFVTRLLFYCISEYILTKGIRDLCQLVYMVRLRE